MPISELVNDIIDATFDVECYYHHCPANLSGHPDNWTPDESELYFDFLGDTTVIIPLDQIDEEEAETDEWEFTYRHYDEMDYEYLVEIKMTLIRLTLTELVIKVEIVDVDLG